MRQAGRLSGCLNKKIGTVGKCRIGKYGVYHRKKGMDGWNGWMEWMDGNLKSRVRYDRDIVQEEGGVGRAR